MINKKMFPLYFDLTDTNVTFIGGGKIAERRIFTILDFVKSVKVIAPEITPALEKLYVKNKIIWIKRAFEENDTEGADMVLTMTNSKEVNNRVYEECRKNHILVNNAGDGNQSEFHFPGIICYDGIVIGFNGGGNKHTETRKIREKVEAFLKSQGKENQEG